MTAATLTPAPTVTRRSHPARNVRSAFPTAVDELLPLARDYAAELGDTPTRNQLMKRFRIGAPKAKTLLAALTPAPTTTAEPAEPAEPAASAVPAVPGGEPERLAPLIIVEDEAAKLFAEFRGRPSAPAEPREPADAPVPAAPAGDVARHDIRDTRAAVGAAVGERTRISRYGMGALLMVVGVLLAGVIVAPIALSSQDIIAWAASPTGLGLTGVWPLVTFFALDAAAAVCVGLVVYCAWRGESAGVFAWLVWAFAGMSAYANYSHSVDSPARDAVWFFPAMSLAGPFLLEIIVRRVRRWVQEGTGQRARHSVSFGLGRWIPGVGALRETYGAWRLARLNGINDADQAVTAYRQLCPDGSVRVLRALRNRPGHAR